MLSTAKRVLNYFSKKRDDAKCLICGHMPCPGCLDWCDHIFIDDDEDDWLCCGGSCIYEEEDNLIHEYCIYMKNLNENDVRIFLEKLDVKLYWELEDESCPLVTACGNSSEILKINEKYRNYSLNHEDSNPFCKNRRKNK